MTRPSNAMSLRAIPLWLALGLGAGGTSGCVVSEGCDAVCETARPTYELCMEEWGLAYGDRIGGYESAQDYDDWCSTYNRERRLLASTADDQEAAEAALDARCEQQRTDLESEDCGLYYSVFTEPAND